MHDVQVRMLAAKVQFDELLNKLADGIEVDVEIQESIEDVYVTAVMELEEWVTPLLIAAAKKKNSNFGEYDVRNLFNCKMDETVEMVLRLRF